MIATKLRTARTVSPACAQTILDIAEKRVRLTWIARPVFAINAFLEFAPLRVVVHVIHTRSAKPLRARFAWWVFARPAVVVLPVPSNPIAPVTETAHIVQERMDAHHTAMDRARMIRSAEETSTDAVHALMEFVKSVNAGLHASQEVITRAVLQLVAHFAIQMPNLPTHAQSAYPATPHVKWITIVIKRDHARCAIMEYVPVIQEYAEVLA